MHSLLRNIVLIIRREYLQRVRTKAFIFSTLLIPAMMLGFSVLPSVFMNMSLKGEHRVAVASDDPQLTQMFQQQLTRESKGTGTTYKITIDPEADGKARDRLNAETTNKKIDGYLWLTKEAIASGAIEYHTRAMGDFIETAQIQAAANRALTQQRLMARGVQESEIDSLLKKIEVNAVSVQKGKSSGDALFFTVFILVMILYMTVALHGLAVMRSIVEEKASRVMEVMLSIVTPKELMAGKIIGVGAVGLTQIAVWGMIAAIFSGPVLAAASRSIGKVHFSPVLLIAFPVAFILGFLLYSALSAALGAMVNSDEEAQQLQMFVMLPLIAALMLMFYVVRAPSSGIAVALSLIPFFSPLLMYTRIVAEQPPLWQLLLCVGLMLATIYAVLSLCARVYRVGILMYGKRPTLPEIMKWIKYA